jgi:hypothetical protein
MQWGWRTRWLCIKRWWTSTPERTSADTKSKAAGQTARLFHLHDRELAMFTARTAPAAHTSPAATPLAQGAVRSRDDLVTLGWNSIMDGRTAD